MIFFYNYLVTAVFSNIFPETETVTFFLNRKKNRVTVFVSEKILKNIAMSMMDYLKFSHDSLCQILQTDKNKKFIWYQIVVCTYIITLFKYRCAQMGKVQE